MTELELKEQQLNDRKLKLENSIQELKDNILSEDIEKASRQVQTMSLELSGLQTQLELTQLALEKAQDKLRARKEFEASKEYKDKQKMQEKLYSEAQKEAEKHFEKLSELIAEIQETFNLVEQADRISLELAENKDFAQHRFKIRAEPYSRLWNIRTYLKNELADRAFRMRKAQEMK
jgi:hypothetical protein